MKKPVILIVGAGNVGLRVVERLRGRARVFATARRRERDAALQALGATPLRIDLDRPRTFRALDATRRIRWDAVVYLAPPDATTPRDTRLRRLIGAILPNASQRLAFVYVSTSGVYGDCAGAHVSETRPPRATNARAKRRIDAERTVHSVARRTAWRATVLRAPGIYDAEHLPVDRIARGLPAIVAEQDSFTNHVHADDLAAMCLGALRSKRGFRVYNANDDTQLRMGDWFDRVADAFGLDRPPRVSREEARARVSPMVWSFMNESRRLSNARIKRELRVRLRWPTVDAWLASNVERPRRS